MEELQVKTKMRYSKPIKAWDVEVLVFPSNIHGRFEFTDDLHSAVFTSGLLDNYSPVKFYLFLRDYISPNVFSFDTQQQAQAFITFVEECVYNINRKLRKNEFHIDIKEYFNDIS